MQIEWREGYGAFSIGVGNLERKVGEEIWDFLDGADADDDLIDIFERVGIELRGEIDDYFSKFNLT